MELLKNFEKKNPEIVFEWNDSETDAKGWVVINSLRGGAAAGGTRMRKGVTKSEVLALAKTMEIKFSVAGPPIGGGKSGINFDPNDPRKEDVLKRWYSAVKPLLKTYYGTGGDMNIDEVKDVIPICKENGIHFPLEGVIRGHYQKSEKITLKIIEQLSKGVPLIVKNKNLTPNPNKNYTIGDLITGFGVSESVAHFYDIYGGKLKDKKVIIQGWGNVAGAAAFYLSQYGAKIIGIIDKNGGLIKEGGFNLDEIIKLIEKRSYNTLESNEILPFEEANDKIWNLKADIFIPAAASRLINHNQLDKMIKNGLELISSGANVPFADNEIFMGKISKYADENISVIPDFIANCGMARVFAYLMEENARISDIEIFNDTSETIKNAIIKVYRQNKSKYKISETALKIALNKLV